VRRRLDDDSFSIRFSPRKPRSIWSRVNVAHVERLIKAGRMTKAGLAAYAKRDDRRTGIYSFEKPPVELPPAYVRRFKSTTDAGPCCGGQPPWSRRPTTHWVRGAKREETRARRLAPLTDCCPRGTRIPKVTPPSK